MTDAAFKIGTSAWLKAAAYAHAMEIARLLKLGMAHPVVLARHEAEAVRLLALSADGRA